MKGKTEANTKLEAGSPKERKRTKTVSGLNPAPIQIHNKSFQEDQ